MQRLQSEIRRATAELSSQQRTIDSLRHGLIETDMELDTVQRLKRRQEVPPAAAGADKVAGGGKHAEADLSAYADRRADFKSSYSYSSRGAAAADPKAAVPSVGDGSRQNLSAAVKAALDAAAALKNKHELELAMKASSVYSREFSISSRSDVLRNNRATTHGDADRYEDISGFRRSTSAAPRSYAEEPVLYKGRLREETTPPRDKRFASSSSPSSFRDPVSPETPNTGGRSSSAPRYSRPSGIPTAAAGQGSWTGVIRSSVAVQSQSSSRDYHSSSDSRSPSNVPVNQQGVKRKVKAILRKT